MKRVGFLVHPGRSGAREAADQLRAWLRDHGVETTELGDDAADADGVDLIVSVGGDGTFLRAALVAARADVPILGVKVGRMGFLTEAEPHEAPAVLQRLLDGSARIEERLAVVAELEAGGVASQWALNEVIVEKATRHRLVRLAVFVGDCYVTTFSADGVLVATPTGSTAYSFSAGGPIVSPSVPCLVLNPIAAHMVFDRSFVLGADERVTLEVMGDEPGLLSADGRESLELPVGARVLIGRAPQPARLVRRDDAPPFHELLRRKFGLPGPTADGPV